MCPYVPSGNSPWRDIRELGDFSVMTRGNHQQSWFQPEQKFSFIENWWFHGFTLKNKGGSTKKIGWIPRIIRNTIQDMDINQPCWAKTRVFFIRVCSTTLHIVVYSCIPQFIRIHPNSKSFPCTSTFQNMLFCWQYHVVDVQYFNGLGPQNRTATTMSSHLLVIDMWICHVLSIG